MENNQGIKIPDVEVETDIDAENKTTVKKLKSEMQCPVCDQIPTSIPIPACSMGHIVCKQCKEKILTFRIIDQITTDSSSSRTLSSDIPCPICRSPLENTSYVAGKVISLFLDIPCSNKNSGCSFEGSLEDIKTHSKDCMFNMVFCFVCEENCTRKDFPSHNNKDCFLKSPSNTFRFPDRDSLYLIQLNREEEILVEACYVNDAGMRMDENEIDLVGFTFFLLENSSSLTSLPMMKIVMSSHSDDPSSQIEATKAITAGPYMGKKMSGPDLALDAVRDEVSNLSFEILDQQ